MNWKKDVEARFSDSEDGSKWDEMYEKATERLDDEFFRLRRDFTVDFVVNKYNQNAKICDVGCGAGPVTFELLDRGFQVTGLDYSSNMLMKTKRRLDSVNIKNQPLVNGNCEQLPFQDETFDCVVCLGVISYVENYANIINEIYRVLKPEGTTVISFRNKYNLVFNDPFILAIFLVKRLFFLDKEKEFQIGRYMNIGEVTGTAESAGFSFIHYKGIGFGPYSINHKKLFKEKKSILISNCITRFAEKINAELVFKLASDVNILIFQKPWK